MAVVTLLRLKTAMLHATLRESPWTLVPLAVSTALGCLATWSTVQDFATKTSETSGDAVLLRGSGAFIVCLVGALLLPTPTYRLTPRALHRFHLGVARVASADLVSSLLHPLVLLVAGGATAIAMYPPRAPGRIIAVLTVWGTTAAMFSAARAVSESRRFALRLLLGAVIAAGLTLLSFESRFIICSPQCSDAAGAVLRASPFGAVWAALTQPQPAAAVLALAVGWLLALIGCAAGATAISARSDRARRPAIAWPRTLVARHSPMSAIASRQFVYAIRDPRRWGEMAGATFLVASAVSFSRLTLGTEQSVWVGVLGVTLFVGISPHNSLAMDRTTLWPELMTAVSGFEDRMGRVIVPLAGGATAAMLGAPALITAGGSTAGAAALMCASFALLFAALGISCVTSILAPYSPRQDETNSSAPAQSLREVAVWVLVVGLSLGCVAPSINAVASSRPDAFAVVFADLAACVVVFVIGLSLGALAYEHLRMRWFAQSVVGHYSLTSWRRDHA